MLATIGAITSIGGDIFGAWSSYKLMNKQIEQMQKQNDLLAKQYGIETQRYNKREKERDEANSFFQNTFSNIYNKYKENYSPNQPTLITQENKNNTSLTTQPVLENKENKENKEPVLITQRD